MARSELLHPTLRIPVSYRDEWTDGLGARGWKLNCGVNDPAVLAVTAYTGEKVPTSVLIHDILDHIICGFGLSGHRNEAKATLQLGLRVGTEIASSYARLADDIATAGVNGESLAAFLPPPLRSLLPSSDVSEREMMAVLIRECGRPMIMRALMARLWALGNQGRSEALTSWSRRSLDYTRRSAIGMCLQHLLEEAERTIQTTALNVAQGYFILGNQACALCFAPPLGGDTTFFAQHAVDIVTYPTPHVSNLTLQGCTA